MNKRVKSISKYNFLLIALKIYTFLNLKRKKQASYLFALMIICGIVELLTLASIVPFLIVITEPERLLNINLFYNLFNNFDIRDQKGVLLFTTIIFILSSFFTMIIRISNLYFSTRFSAIIGSEFSKKVFEATLHKTYIWHLNNNTSDLINDITYKISLLTFYLKSFLNLFTQIIVALSLLTGLLIFDGLSTVFAASLFLIAYLIIAFLLRKRFERNGLFAVMANQKIIKILQEGYGLIRDIIMNNLQNQFLIAYAENDAPMRIKEAENEFLKTCPKFILEAICFLLVGSLSFLLTLKKGNTSEIIFTLGTLSIGALKLLPAMQAIYTEWANLKTFYPAANSILKIISDKNINKTNLLKIKKSPFKKDINLKNIAFSYNQESKNLILKEVNLTIKRGQKVGIVGSTGSGKSTLIDLIMCLLKPYNGDILIDQKKINFSNEKELISWRLNISHVPQDIYLSDSSIIDNIAFEVDKKNIDMERIYDSAKKSMIFEFINSLPEGFNTVVGERGVRLSGGQKQRIGIARALYKKSSIIIFDEATSALDNKTESKVMECINNLSKEKLTIILIAHRKTTLANCDIVFEVINSTVKVINLK